MVKTIDMTPTWTATAQMITTVVKHGTGDKEGICEEILKMGQLLDQYDYELKENEKWFNEYRTWYYKHKNFFSDYADFYKSWRASRKK
jgi:hypothetical protein